MFENPSFNEQNEITLCEMGKKHPEMLMTIKVKKLLDGENITINDEQNESAVLLLSGKITLEWDGESATCTRANPFEKTPYCLHVCKQTEMSITSHGESEILIQQTDNDLLFPPMLYTPDTCLYQEFGKGQWDGTGHRVVSTMFDMDNAPYSNMVMGEVFNQPGRWSSYPPHHHPQPEVYYYRFNPSQGFGACFNGSEVYKSVDNSFCTIEDGQDHQQVVAPGYTMYYVWMIRHLENDNWYKTTRFYDPNHEWLLK